MMTDEQLRWHLECVSKKDFKYVGLAMLIHSRDAIYQQFLAELNPEATYEWGSLTQGQTEGKTHITKASEIIADRTHAAFGLWVHSWLCDKLKSLDNDVTT